ncbi:iporin isoform X2 [Thalassophryne amazonica]|uniref:iporin isoform X2 n=1 Tax=Thalassophryne amazonica TaxID=390379 RepID=UPI0014717396|nr:iporin isoform X2 [Thalassophryne amazonica]
MFGLSSNLLNLKSYAANQSLLVCLCSAGISSHESGGLCSSSDSCPVVIRYSKDQRPTTLPIQPFTFHHQFASKPPQPKPVLPLLSGYISGMQARSGSGGSEEEESEDVDKNVHKYQAGHTAAAPPPGSVRPSPLGSYSPVRLQGAPSSGTCSTCTPSPQPAHSVSCPLSVGLGPLHSPPATKQSTALPPTPLPPSLGVKKVMVPPPVQGQCFHRGTLHSDTLSLLGCIDSAKHRDGSKGPGTRSHNVSQQSCSELLPEYFSLTEKPPEEFCLSPDASSSSSKSHISVDLKQKRALVKAVNMAVDLIVAHFGTSRDPDVKAKLGNSWVSPNVGHLILKYLCPALREVLQDGLKAYVLDLIIGQRRCQPWILVEASTQLGPSTRVLHSLFSKVSQYSELTSHSMRLNAFIFGLLNLKCLEFWFNHLYTHEDIIAAHYNPWGFLPLSQGVCQNLFEELLLLLQPLSLLPFDLDLMFEPHLLQKGQEHLRRKEQLCSAGQSVDLSTRSTFQLMQGWSTTMSELVREGVDSRTEVKKERAELRREGTWPSMERTGSRRGTAGVRSSVRSVGAAAESLTGPVGGSVEVELDNLWKERGHGGRRVKGVGQESQEESEDKRWEKDRDLADDGRQRHNRQAGWWYQLMQSSQVYIDQSTEVSKFIKSEKRKKFSERRQGSLPPTREGVVEGAESNQETEGYSWRKSSDSSSMDSAGSRGRPSWMGSPPDSVLNQEKDPKPLEVTESRVQEESPSQGQSLRWGRLFGSSVGAPLRVEGAEQRVKPQKTRPPSGWLGLDKSVLDLVAQTIVGGSGKKAESPAMPPHNKTTCPKPQTKVQTTESNGTSLCEVRALCHHIATEPGHLSFSKGDLLQVLSKADADWLLCSLGSSQGLVPIVFVTLNGLEDSQAGLVQC